MKIVKRGILLLCAVFVVVWLGSYLWCEGLTALYGDQFSDSALWTSDTLLGEAEDLKVLEYSDTSATIYHISPYPGAGYILEFTRSEPGAPWQLECWDAIWSKHGSADGLIWPYGRYTIRTIHHFRLEF